ncbi:MAG TPA: hypothetical protein VNO75_04120 [Gemmatimonadaceae bacterium]|nr:hypothetical protein [Gemmatimonadaceae bacterium]
METIRQRAVTLQRELEQHGGNGTSRLAVDEARKKDLTALKLAAVRLGILRDRMEGCNDQAREEGREPTHELVDEASAFVYEARVAAEMVDDSPAISEAAGK